MMLDTYIKLCRKMKQWEWYHDSKMVHLFIHLLLSANFKQNKWQGKTIEKGQILTGLGSLNKQTGISTQSLRTCLNRLKSTGEVTVKSTNKHSLITLLNWGDYQDTVKELTDQSTGKLTNEQQTSNKRVTTPNKDKKVKKAKEKTYSDFDFFKTDLFRDRWKDYLEMRIKIRKPATLKAEELALKKLVKLSDNKIDTAIEILQQSIMNSWQGLFPLKIDKKGAKNTRYDVEKLDYSKEF